jgi:hypothetical protein
MEYVHSASKMRSDYLHAAAWEAMPVNRIRWVHALMARAHRDAAAYAHFRDRYRDMAISLGFEGHIAWAEAMT